MWDRPFLEELDEMPHATLRVFQENIRFY